MIRFDISTVSVNRQESKRLRGDTSLKEAEGIQLILAMVIAVLLIAGTVGAVANASTGITIPHTGYTVNLNVTSSPGLAPVARLFPVFYVAGGILTLFLVGYRRMNNPWPEWDRR